MAGRAKRECKGDVLNKEERKGVMEWIAEIQRDCPLLIRVVGCPMYTILLQEKEIKVSYFPAHLLYRIPYYGKGCAAGMPGGYIVIRENGEVNPCMLLQINLGNIKQKSITSIWEESPILSKSAPEDLKALAGIAGIKRYAQGVEEEPMKRKEISLLLTQAVGLYKLTLRAFHIWSINR